MELVACTKAAVGPALLGRDAGVLAGAPADVDVLLANGMDDSAPPGLMALVVLIPDGIAVRFA